MDELKQAFEIYNADMRKADKKYTQYNIPAAYATMLTNKDSTLVFTTGTSLPTMANTWLKITIL